MLIIKKLSGYKSKSEIQALNFNNKSNSCAHFIAIQVMLLTLLLFISILVLFQIRFSILSELHFLAEPLHQVCLNLLPDNPKTQSVLQALVCGHNFESFETSHWYVSSGLIHLFVVSGSHLIIIYKVLYFIFKKLSVDTAQKYIFIILFFYAAVCLFNPPITRSLLGIFIFDILKTKVKYWPTDYVLFLVGLSTLILSPNLISSISLQMSWLAALGIEASHRYLNNKNRLIQQIPFYVFYTFSFSALGFPQMTVLIIALFFNPVLEFVLLPMACLVLAFPFLDPVFELMIECLNFTLSHFEMNISPVTTPFENSVSYNWILIFLIHFLLHFNRKKT